MAKKNIKDTIEAFWGNVIEDEEISIQHRLKASELLIKVKEDDSLKGVVVISGETELED